MVVAQSPALAVDLPDKGTTPYVTHFVFRPLESIDVPGAKVTAFEATGITSNMEGGQMLDKM
jgi:hypothetical protein